VDERLRKSLKDIREFMPKDQLELIAKMRDIQVNIHKLIGLRVA